MACSPAQYQVVFPSPIKPSINLDNLDESLQGTGLYAQYHVFPKVLTRSAAKREAALMGQDVLAFVKRSRIISTPDISKTVQTANMQAWSSLKDTNKKNKVGLTTWDKRSCLKNIEGEHGQGSASDNTSASINVDVHSVQGAAALKNKEGEHGQGSARDNTSTSINVQVQSVQGAAILKNIEGEHGQGSARDNTSTSINVEVQSVQGAATCTHDTNIAKTAKLTTWDALSTDSLSTKLDLVLLKMEKLEKYQEKIAKEIKLYQGTTKRLVVMNLISLEVIMLDYFLQMYAVSPEYSSLEGFLDLKSITFYKLYWFYFNEVIFEGNANFNVYSMWQKRLPNFKPTALQLAQPKDYKKYIKDVVGSIEAQDAAHVGFALLEKAAKGLISFGGLHCPISARLLIESCGFYVSLLVSERNGTIHIIENLFLWPDEEKTRRKNMRKRNYQGQAKRMTNQAQSTIAMQEAAEISKLSFPFPGVVNRAIFLEDHQGQVNRATNQEQSTKVKNRNHHGQVKRMANQEQSAKVKQEAAEVSFPYPINEAVANRAMVFLEDIIESHELFEEADLKPIKSNVVWFANMLLSLCKKATEKAEAAQHVSASVVNAQAAYHG